MDGYLNDYVTGSINSYVRSQLTGNRNLYAVRLCNYILSISYSFTTSRVYCNDRSCGIEVSLLWTDSAHETLRRGCCCCCDDDKDGRLRPTTTPPHMSSHQSVHRARVSCRWFSHSDVLARTNVFRLSLYGWTTAYPSQLLAVFSRSYCYTVWSAIGIILLSVCLSVCLSVTLCIVALRVGVEG